MAKAQERRPSIHPGEILRVDYGPSGSEHESAGGRSAGAGDTNRGDCPRAPRHYSEYGLTVARYFNTSPGYWLNLQSAYDLEVAQDKLSRVIERKVRPASRAAAHASC